MRALKVKSFLIVLTFLILPLVINAQAPQLINYQGSIQQDGTPLTGEVNIIFSIFDAETAGTNLWSENQSGINVASGVFQVMLGSVTAFPADLFSNDGERYLEVSVEGTVLTPRSKFTSVAYALTAQMAEEVKAGEVVTSINNIEDDITLTAGSNIEITSAGNEIKISSTAGGTGGGDITAVSSGEGITGGGETGDVTVGLDIPFTDSKYVNISEPNSVTSLMIQDGQVRNEDIAGNAISSGHINDESGLVFDAPGSVINLVSTEHTDLAVVTITVPQSGYIFLSGRGMVDLRGTTLGNGIRMQIDETAGGTDQSGVYSYIYMNEFTSEILNYFDCSAQRVYTVDAAGEYSFRLEARKQGTNGTAAVLWSVLTAQYFPTAYGTVTVSSSTATGSANNPQVEPGQ